MTKKEKDNNYCLVFKMCKRYLREEKKGTSEEVLKAIWDMLVMTSNALSIDSTKILVELMQE